MSSFHFFHVLFLLLTQISFPSPPPSSPFVDILPVLPQSSAFPLPFFLHAPTFGPFASLSSHPPTPPSPSLDFFAPLYLPLFIFFFSIFLFTLSHLLQLFLLFLYLLLFFIFYSSYLLKLLLLHLLLFLVLFFTFFYIGHLLLFPFLLIFFSFSSCSSRPESRRCCSEGV